MEKKYGCLVFICKTNTAVDFVSLFSTAERLINMKEWKDGDKPLPNSRIWIMTEEFPIQSMLIDIDRVMVKEGLYRGYKIKHWCASHTLQILSDEYEDHVNDPLADALEVRVLHNVVSPKI